MDNNLILSIVSIIATLLFGFLSVDFLKKKRYPGKITYVKLSLIDLLNNVAGNFDEIKLLHKELPINKNIIYIKGVILNNGIIDINSMSTEKDITIELPPKSKWLNIKPTKSSNDLSVSIEINENEQKSASFKFDLFRKNEFVQFEGLIESDDSKMTSNTLENKIKFRHRIENTSKVEKKKLLTRKEVKKKKYAAFRYLLILLITILGFTIIYLFNIFGTYSETIYFEKKSTIYEDIYKANLKDSKIELHSVILNSSSFSIPVEEFNLNYKATSKKLSFKQKFLKLYWVLFIQLIIFSMMVMWELIEINRNRKLNKILYQVK